MASAVVTQVFVDFFFHDILLLDVKNDISGRWTYAQIHKTQTACQ